MTMNIINMNFLDFDQRDYDIAEFIILNKEQIKRKMQSMVTILSLVLESPIAYETYIDFCNISAVKLIKEEVESSLLLNGEECVNINKEWLEYVLGEPLINLTKEDIT